MRHSGEFNVVPFYKALFQDMTPKDGNAQISDHLPLWAEFEINSLSQELDQILNPGAESLLHGLSGGTGDAGNAGGEASVRKNGKQPHAPEADRSKAPARERVEEWAGERAGERFIASNSARLASTSRMKAVIRRRRRRAAAAQ